MYHSSKYGKPMVKLLLKPFSSNCPLLTVLLWSSLDENSKASYGFLEKMVILFDDYIMTSSPTSVAICGRVPLRNLRMM